MTAAKLPTGVAPSPPAPMIGVAATPLAPGATGVSSQRDRRLGVSPRPLPPFLPAGVSSQPRVLMCV